MTQIWKFGGTSLGTPGRLTQVLALIRAEPGPLAIVVSALGDTTDWLIEAARAAEAGTPSTRVEQVEHLALSQASEAGVDLTDELAQILGPVRRLIEGITLLHECTPRTLDEIMSAGERISTALVSKALGVEGIDTRELFTTDDVPQNANVELETTVAAIRKRITANKTVLCGFIARSHDGHTTTLGRNGSDYTASVVALALGAREVTVWTDVPGVFTADPRLVNEAWPVTRLTYAEALELAHFGTTMFHARTVIPLQESGAALTIRSTTEPGRPGTRIDAIGHTADDQPTCVTSLENLALLSLESRRSSLPPMLISTVLVRFARAGVRLWMTNQSGLGVSASFVIAESDIGKATSVLSSVIAGDEAQLGPVRSPVSLVSLVAERMGQRPNVAGRFFHALGNVGIPVLAISQGASQRSISCVVTAEDTAIAVRTVHGAFNLSEIPVHVALLGHGTVGGRLLVQLEEQREQLRKVHGIRVELVGLFGSRSGVFDSKGLDPALARRQLVTGVTIESSLEALARLPNPVVVDCTSASLEGLYRTAFTRGIHVVAANKKALTLALPITRDLQAQARRASRNWLYETTCGASLPVIETLKNLVRTGDDVLRIDGALSGTLGFLSDALMNGVPLSKAVREARERGFTEPHPRDDLSGLDVARKALILARELGAELELSDVAIEPFVPREFLAEDDPEAFLSGLERADASFAEKIAQYRKAGLTWRYLAQVERIGESIKLKVGPVGVESSHPAASLRSAEALVAFTTRRYREYPLIVRGAGAGGDVTAAGVLADILRLAQNVRGT